MNNKLIYILFVHLFANLSFAEVILYPQNCLTEKINCAVQVKRTTEEIKLKSLKITMAPDTSILLNSDHDVVVMRGVVKLSLRSLVKISTQNIDMQADSGSFWVTVTNSKTELQNVMANNLKVYTKNKRHLESLPEGFENYYVGYNAQKQFQMGVLKPINFDSYLRQHLKYSTENKQTQIDDLKIIKENVEKAQEMSSALYQEVISRDIASFTNNEKKQEQRRIQRTQEQERLKELYRKKTLEQ